MSFSREQVYAELKRLYDVYNPFRRPFFNIGRPVLDDDQVTIYTSYYWKGPDGRWVLTNYYMGKYMDVIIPNIGTVVGGGGYYSKITFDPYVPASVGEMLNLLYSNELGGFVDMLGNRLIIEYHYKNRDKYLDSFATVDERRKIDDSSE